MTGLADLLGRSLLDLVAMDAPACLVGGLAVSARVEPRFTRDVDLAVAVADDAAAERLVHALVGRGYRVGATVEQTAAGRLATARLVPPGEEPGGRVVDLLFASSGIEAEIVADADALEVLPGVVARVARAGHLVAMKLLSRSPHRPQDHADLVALRALLDDPEELARARTGASLITARGFARDRDMAALLGAYLSGSPT